MKWQPNFLKMSFSQGLSALAFSHLVGNCADRYFFFFIVSRFGDLLKDDHLIICGRGRKIVFLTSAHICMFVSCILSYRMLNFILSDAKFLRSILTRLSFISKSYCPHPVHLRKSNRRSLKQSYY